jgi:hypothetical protein
VVSDEAVLRPRIEQPTAYRLKSTRNRADYLVIAPKALLEAAQPLLELRGRQGLASRAVAFSVDYNETTRSAAATFSASTLGVR